MMTLQCLMAESHESMRDGFEITVPEIDQLVDIIKSVVGELGGVRMTRGCVVSIVPDNLVAQVTEEVNDKYLKLCGLTPSVFVCSAEEGAS